MYKNTLFMAFSKPINRLCPIRQNTIQCITGMEESSMPNATHVPCPRGITYRLDMPFRIACTLSERKSLESRTSIGRTSDYMP